MFTIKSIPYEDFDKCITFFCDNNFDYTKYHGHHVTMTGFASNIKDSKRTAGIAPKAKVIPYHENTPWGWAKAIRHAREKNVSAISMSMGIERSEFNFAIYILDKAISFFTNNKSFKDEVDYTVNKGYPIIFSLPNPDLTRNKQDVLKTKNVDIEEDYTSSISSVIKVGSVYPVESRRNINFISTQPNQNNQNNQNNPNNQITYNIFDTLNNNSQNLFKLSANYSGYSNNAIWAPGGYIYTSHSTNYNDTNPDKQIEEVQGTSFAAPFIAGTVALMKSLKPNLTVQQIKDILKDSSVYQVKSNPNMINDLYQEFDHRVRMIDVKEALKRVRRLPDYKYYVRIYNIDDTGYVYLNLNNILTANYFNDTGYIDITNLLQDGINNFDFRVVNTQGGYTWGFEIKENNKVIFKDVAGTVGVMGANNNDQTTGLVYNHNFKLEY